MRFLVNMLNHSPDGQRSLEDVIGIFGQQLRELGHEIAWDPKNTQWYPANEGINIMVEGFTDGSIFEIKRAYDQGCRFIYLATEEPTPKGFNHGRDLEMVKRQAKFEEAARYCEGIFYLVPGQHVHDWYNQFKPAAYVELGHARVLRRPDPPARKFDFGFFGSLTPRRHRILKMLAKVPLVVYVDSSFPDQATRDQRIQQCKVVLQLRKHAEMGLVSSSRCNTALNLGCAVLAEPHDQALSKPWDEIVRFSKYDPVTEPKAFAADAIMVKAAWRGVHLAQYEKFKTLLTPDYCVGRAFREIGFDLNNYDPGKLLQRTAA